MTVYKNYFKIVNKHKFSILAYSVIFIVLMAMFSSSDSNKDMTYSSVKVDISIINNRDSKIAKGLENHLKKSFNNVVLKEENADDELFYQTVSALVKIPKDFDQNKTIDFKTSPNSKFGMMPKQTINNFLSKVNIYKTSGLSDEEAIKFTEEDLSKSTNVSLLKGKISDSDYHVESYFNFLNYVLMSQIILIVSTVMIVYNKEIISKRNEIAPITKSSSNLQLILGHITMAISIWFIYMILFFVFWPGALELESVKYMILNSFVFTVVIVCMAMMLTRIISKSGTLSAVTNIVALGSSFLAGAFVPQAMLSVATLTFAKILPSYYYIKNNDMLVKDPAMATISTNLLILVAYAVVFIVITILVKPSSRREA